MCSPYSLLNDMECTYPSLNHAFFCSMTAALSPAGVFLQGVGLTIENKLGEENRASYKALETSTALHKDKVRFFHNTSRQDQISFSSSTFQSRRPCDTHFNEGVVVRYS